MKIVRHKLNEKVLIPTSGYTSFGSGCFYAHVEPMNGNPERGERHCPPGSGFGGWVYHWYTANAPAALHSNWGASPGRDREEIHIWEVAP